MKLEDCNALLDFLQCGTPELAFSAILDNAEQTAETWTCVLSQDHKRIHLTGIRANTFRDDIFIEFYGDHLRCKRTFTNQSQAVLHLNELKARLTGISFGGESRDDFFYHNENPRIYETMAFPIDFSRTKDCAKNSEYDITAGNRWADPGVVCERIGRSPYQPFPALLLGNYKRPNGLVFGSLSQRQCYHNFLLKHCENGTIDMQAFSSFKALDYRNLEPGEIITDWWYLGTVDDVTNLETIFNKYSDVLREILPPMYGATKINRDNLVWGTWNDGIFRDVTEDLITTEADFLKKNFPTVRWIQLDDGYSVEQKDIAHALGLPYEGEKGIDYAKFPQGLRHLTDRIKEIGLRPALWIGGFCPKETPIFKEHPEWFIDYDYRVTDSAPLDVSQKAVRDYMTHALDILIEEYGFESVKHDFWSYAFEDSNSLYKEKAKSGYEFRSWWVKEMRKRLASDGYFQTGCDIVMGNPFLGECFTNYRYGIDIGSGNWDHVRTNYLWGMACFATHTSDLFVPNSDAIGLFPGLNDTEAEFCNTYCLVTHSMVEIAGRLSQCDHASPRYKMLHKCACNPNNGQEIFFAEWNYLNASEKYPKVIYFKTPHFSVQENADGLPVRTAGLFNLEDSEQEISFTLESMGLDGSKSYILTNVWKDECQVISGTYHAIIPAHGSQLVAISEIPVAEKIALLDADTRIISAEYQGNTLVLTNDYESEATLHFNKDVSSLRINGRQISCKGKIVTLHLPENATLAIC